MPLLALTVAGGCTLGSPLVGPGSGSVDAGIHFADALVSTLVSGQVTDCASSPPSCADGTPQPGACGMNPALGPPDGVGFPLNPGDELEVGFICDGFVTAQPDGGDFAIFANLAGGTGVVEVSQDGSTFSPVGILVENQQTFSLSAVPTDQANFVRVTGQGNGSLSIDSVEAF